MPLSALPRPLYHAYAPPKVAMPQIRTINNAWCFEIRFFQVFNRINLVES